LRFRGFHPWFLGSEFLDHGETGHPHGRRWLGKAAYPLWPGSQEDEMGRDQACPGDLLPPTRLHLLILLMARSAVTSSMN
jgi:hypothetical protein